MEMLKIISPGLVFPCKPVSLASSRNLLHFLSFAVKFWSIDVSHRGNVWNSWKFTRKSCHAMNMGGAPWCAFLSFSIYPSRLGAFFFKVPVFSAFRMGLRLKSWHPNALEVCSRFRSRTTKPGCIFYKLSHSSNIFFYRDFRSGDLLCVRVPRSVRVVCARVDGCAMCISWKCARFSKYPDLIKLIKFQMRVRSTLLLPWVSVNNTYQRN